MGISGRLIALTLFLGVVQIDIAQRSGVRQNAASCLCKDGTYSHDVTRSMACTNHGGIKRWYVAKQSASGGGSALSRQDSTNTSKAHSLQEATAKTASESAIPPATIPASVASAPRVSGGDTNAPLRVPGGTPDLVWLDASNVVYYCYGAERYGIGTSGNYMNESEAIAKGAHGFMGKSCSK